MLSMPRRVLPVLASAVEPVMARAIAPLAKEEECKHDSVVPCVTDVKDLKSTFDEVRRALEMDGSAITTPTLSCPKNWYMVSFNRANGLTMACPYVMLWTHPSALIDFVALNRQPSRPLHIVQRPLDVPRNNEVYIEVATCWFDMKHSWLIDQKKVPDKLRWPVYPEDVRVIESKHCHVVDVWCYVL